jgi:MOSC domain-containing protein YiiM
MAEKGAIVSINISETVGVMKRPVPAAELVGGMGIKGDAHAGPGPRQVSLMGIEDIARAREQASPAAIAELAGLGVTLGPGSYAENITTQGLDLSRLRLGDTLIIGASIRLRISGRGKTCHHGCEIRQKLGDCIFPRVGVFAVVVTGGVARPGDTIETD